MFELDPRVALIAVYEAVALLTLALLAQSMQKNKDHEREFDCEHFFYFAFWLPLFLQAGFIALGYGLLRENIAATRTLTGLAIILWPTLALYTLGLFALRYHRIENVVRRLERLRPGEREVVLAKLPQRKLQALPGDYRFISVGATNSYDDSWKQLPPLVRQQILEALYNAEKR